MTTAKQEKVLSVGDVAKVFGVNPKTANRWAQQGLLPSFRTPGGHFRFNESEIRTRVDRSGETV